MSSKHNSFYAQRHYFVLLLLALLFVGLVGRAAWLQVVRQDFLLDEGSQRQLRVLTTPAYRGSILDREGHPLAISTPVDSVWANPKQALLDKPGLKKTARLLKLDYAELLKRLQQRASREFVYIRRRVEPELAQRAAAAAEGVYLQREYDRFYPAGEVVAQVVGFTNIDGVGQEGLERIHEQQLRAVPGKRKVIRNRKGEVVENIAQIRAARPGTDIVTSIDMRLQYLAYRSLAATIRKYGARAGSVVLLDARSGEVLALANWPSYNPNQRRKSTAAARRNRAITDVFEPGSTIKPFTLAAALDQGLFDARSRIDTSPGYMRVTGYPIRDFRNYGVLDLAGILRKSSNVGASKVAQAMPAEALWQAFHDFGFGEDTGVAFPAASSGYLSHYSNWRPLDQATLAFGYGLSLSTLQLARAYAAFANDGRLPELTLIRRDGGEPAPAKQVMRPETARQVLAMLEQVVGPDGTARKAAIEGYRVAGKTGTVKKTAPGGGYLEDRYRAVFAGIAPASDPRLVMAVVIDDPDKDKGYYGGAVAAPLFREVMTQALRLLDISPDDVDLRQQLALGPDEIHAGGAQ